MAWILICSPVAGLRPIRSGTLLHLQGAEAAHPGFGSILIVYDASSKGSLSFVFVGLLQFRQGMGFSELLEDGFQRDDGRGDVIGALCSAAAGSSRLTRRTVYA
jgi:hypothetical protein